MACVIVPITEAIVTTIAKKVIEKKEMKAEAVTSEVNLENVKLEKFSTKLGRLNKLLWGGSALLAFEHIWHGEVTAFFPFLTAASNPTDLSAMFHEMSTVGVGMAILTTAVWAGSCLVIDAIDRSKVDSKERA